MKLIFILVVILAGANGKLQGLVRVNDDNWEQIMSGEWMVEFYAPWCPACRNLQPVWEEFATWSQDLEIRVGQVDITQSPGLSGRFMITALPTIYHIKEGAFRQYRGPRSKDDFLSFVEEKKWVELEPLSTWQSPSSIPMTLVSQFYRVSMVLRNVFTSMVDDYGIPPWAGYLIFGLITILVGLILGLLLVCVIDFFYPPPPPLKLQVPSQSANVKDKKQGNDAASEDGEDLEDDAEGDDDRETEEDDSQLSEPEAEEPIPTKEEVGEGERARRRKVRRAD